MGSGRARATTATATATAPTVTASASAARYPPAITARAAAATVAIRPYIRSSGSACERSCRTRESSTHTPSVPRIAAGERSDTSIAASAASAAAKPSAMPCLAGHMPFRRNQPAAVTAWRATSGTRRAYVPSAAAPASSSPSSAVSPAGCIPGSMIGERPSARARCASVTRVFPARVAGP